MEEIDYEQNINELNEKFKNSQTAGGPMIIIHGTGDDGLGKVYLDKWKKLNPKEEPKCVFCGNRDNLFGKHVKMVDGNHSCVALMCNECNIQDGFPVPVRKDAKFCPF